LVRFSSIWYVICFGLDMVCDFVLDSVWNLHLVWFVSDKKGLKFALIYRSIEKVRYIFDSAYVSFFFLVFVWCVGITVTEG
jgi:hypothetical protein